MVEVPHGADRRAHFDAALAALDGPFPEDLHEFFHANTDTGAWAIGRHVAERLARAGVSALLVRCLVPRTFVDTNRAVDAEDALASGGMTGAIPSYVTGESDRARLRERHAAYATVAASAYEEVCGPGGFALMPHTYGPRTMAIPLVDETIVTRLRDAWAEWSRWPLRPDVDLITLDPEGVRHAPDDMVTELLSAYRALGLHAVEAETYRLHPVTAGARFARRYTGQTLCVEVRRDLLVDSFHLLEERAVDDTKVERAAGPLVDAIGAWLGARSPA